MLAVVAGSVAAFCLYRQINDQVRRRVEARFAQHYKDLKVSLRSAQLIEGKGIKVYDFSISDPKLAGPAAELLHVEEALFECSTDWKELIKGDPPIRRVTVRRPTIRLSRRPDGTWNLGALLPPPRFGNSVPDVLWENGTIEVLDPQKDPASKLVLRDVNLTMAPVPARSPGANPVVRQFRGTLAGDGLRHVEFEGQLDVHSLACSVRGRADGVEISPELRDSLPEPLAAKFAPLGDLRGQVELGFQFDYDRAAGVPWRFDVAGKLARGRIDDRRLPQALSDIAATFRLNNGGYAVEELTARSGLATLRLSCSGSGFDAGSPLTLAAEVRHLELDPALMCVLPPAVQERWRHYSPAGPIDADVRLDYDGKKWQPQISLTCLDVAFTHYKFPYRLDHGRGSVVLKDDLLKVELTAYSGRQPVRLTAAVTGPFSAAPLGWFEARGADLQIDEALFAALPEKSQEVARSLDPRGNVSFYMRMWRNQPEEPLHQHLVLDFSGGSACFNGFPYLLTNVRGTLEMLDHNWVFRNLSGVHNTAHVTCEGHLMPGLQGRELVLNFVGHDVALEEELRNALSVRNPHMQQVWLDIRPRGVVDLTAEVRCLVEEKKFNIGVRVRPQRETASIEPAYFPYRLDRIQGDLIYTSRDGVGHVEFERCKGEHGPANMPVRVATQGYCEFQPDGRWLMHFEKLSVDQLRADRELSEALPGRLKKAFAELNPSGAMNLRGRLDLEQTGRPGEPLRSQWDMRVGLQQNSLQCGAFLLENVCGEASFRGGFDGQHVRSRGELVLDSVAYKDYQFTRVMGPLWIDDRRVLFGPWVDGPENADAASGVAGPPQKPRLLTAAIFGGTLYGEGWVTLESTPRYGMSVTLTDANLGQCAREVIPGRQKLSGKVLATAALTGSGRTRNTLSGRGRITLSEGNVYELPVMISLLKILRLQEPNQNGFSDGTVDYRIVGEHVYFDHIVFHGDAISLSGSGQMNFQSQIELTFYCLVGRGELDLPVLKQVVRAASQQLMLIHVDGTLQNPEPKQEALPALNQALQQIRGELENRR
ncbi:MAG: AsmA-like C-terminal region-containing protein [Thermoguttaceae bacterium]